MKASSQATARSAIGAGTSNLVLGTTASTAKAGNYTPTWSEVSSKPTTFAPSTHNHTVSQVTGLQSSLDGKANVSHQHVIADLTDLPVITQSNTANTIVQRGSNGRITVSAPVGDSDVANKGYVDTRTPQIHVVSSLPSQRDASALYFVLE